MNENLTNLLNKRFPHFFKHWRSERQYPDYKFGFECQDGWFNIIWQLCEQIDSHLRHCVQSNKFAAAQIEKINQGHKDYAHLDEFGKQEAIKNWEAREVDVPEIQVQQVKEKFGTLRFYYSGGDSYIEGLVSFAEGMSAVTCEVCGERGKIRSASWVKTLCDKHAKEQNKFSAPAFDKVGSEVYAITKGGRKHCKITDIVSDTEARAIEIFEGTAETKWEPAYGQTQITLFKVLVGEDDYFWSDES